VGPDVRTLVGRGAMTAVGLPLGVKIGPLAPPTGGYPNRNKYSAVIFRRASAVPA
jgi:hypothetical protein